MEAETGQHGQHPPAGVASDVGAVLRRARERGGFDLAQIGDDLHIRTKYLLAIEDGRVRDLPGPTYAVGFVRSYAAYLGLDAAEIVRRFKDESASLSRGPELVFPSGVAERTVPTGMLVAIAVVVLALIYGLWYFIHARSSSTAELIQPPPAQLAAEDHPPPAAVSVSNPAAAPPSSLVMGEALAAPPPPAQPAPPVALPATPTVIAALPPGPPPVSSAATPPRMVLRAAATTWVRVRDANGATLYAKTVHKGDEYDVPAKPDLRLRVGNGEAVALLVDGKPVSPDITAIAAKRDLPLDADRLAAGLAP